jgi:predicted nucleic acid-binding protein
VAEHPAVNASPLIFLAHANLLELLRLLGEEVLVPLAVAEEIRRRGPEDPTARALEATDWLRVIEIPSIPPRIERWDLGAGESAVLAWCLEHPGSEAVIDDLAGRRCADALDIPVRGTLGLVLIAKQRGHLEAARPILESMLRAGMYLSPAVLDRALRSVDE